jgi:hypothetical protein
MYLSALLLSGIAEYYSILGLAAIFGGASPLAIYLMGGALGFSKLMNASWLYRNWRTGPLLLKTYLTFALICLMLITSMGIFGFLAKSHIDSTLDMGQSTIEVQALNQQEDIIKDRLKYLLARAGDPGTASRKIDVQIQDTQKQLTELEQKKLPVLKEQNKLSADVGPVKYVADMVYTNDSAGIDKAVRLVIIIIMLVFDPLAVLSLIAGNISLKNWLEKRNVSDKEAIQEVVDKQLPVGEQESNRQESTIASRRKNRKKQKAVTIARDNIHTLYGFEENGDKK